MGKSCIWLSLSQANSQPSCTNHHHTHACNCITAGSAQVVAASIAPCVRLSLTRSAYKLREVQLDAGYCRYTSSA
jgi:hypothetical protein